MHSSSGAVLNCSGCSVGPIGGCGLGVDAISHSVYAAGVVITLLAEHRAAGFRGVQTQALKADVAMTPEEEEWEDNFGEEVQYTVKDGLGVWVDDIAAFGATESDGVQKEGGDEDNARDVVGGSDGSPDVVRAAASNDEYRVGDI